MIIDRSSILALTQLSRYVVGESMRFREGYNIALWNNHIDHGSIIFDDDNPITVHHILILIGEVE